MFLWPCVLLEKASLNVGLYMCYFIAACCPSLEHSSLIKSLNCLLSSALRHLHIQKCNYRHWGLAPFFVVFYGAWITGILSFLGTLSVIFFLMHQLARSYIANPFLLWSFENHINCGWGIVLFPAPLLDSAHTEGEGLMTRVEFLGTRPTRQASNTFQL